ncbi:MAG: UDP-2,3-diacylglucosamine diphosphatase LpxI [Synergistaceae bacterium]|jgi:DUF1009 family protein|nr:UDP-2,3-diacylglucosamine diphosphatase LpxI [Synergistaceae bacterium]
MTKIALVAGEGALPVEIARRLSESGNAPLVLTLRGDSTAFEGLADPLVKLRGPALSRVLSEMKRHGAKAVMMAGRVPKKLIYFPALFDPMTLKLLASIDARDDHSLLASIVNMFESLGFPVIPYRQILPELLAPAGRIGCRSPSTAESRDVEKGMDVLRVTLPCSFGQAVVVADGSVVAVEAMEGTDAMIERAGSLMAGASGSKGTVVKMMRVDQDERYDLPTVGPHTIETMARSGLTCLAVEAGRTILLDAAPAVSLADANGIAIWGIA